MRLIALLKRGRVFSHTDSPTTYSDVRRFRRNGEQCLRSLDLVAESQRFAALVTQAVMPLYAELEEERVFKSSALRLRADGAADGERHDEVTFINRFMMREALEILARAARSLRDSSLRGHTLSERDLLDSATDLKAQTRSRPGPKPNDQRHFEIAKVVGNRTIGVQTVKQICEDLDKRRIPTPKSRGIKGANGDANKATALPQTWVLALGRDRQQVLDNIRKSVQTAKRLSLGAKGNLS